MTLTIKLLQTLALVACAPVLLAWGILMFSLVMLGSTAQSIGKVWR